MLKLLALLAMLTGMWIWCEPESNNLSAAGRYESYCRCEVARHVIPMDFKTFKSTTHIPND